MSLISQSPLFDYLDQPVSQLDTYNTVFKSAKMIDTHGIRLLVARTEGISLNLDRLLKVQIVDLHSGICDDLSQEYDYAYDSIQAQVQSLEFKAYQHPLPGGLTFDLSREAVRQKLGDPSFTAEADDLRWIMPWSCDLYGSDRGVLIVEYAKGEKQIWRLRVVKKGLPWLAA